MVMRPVVVTVWVNDEKFSKIFDDSYPWTIEELDSLVREQVARTLRYSEMYNGDSSSGLLVYPSGK